VRRMNNTKICDCTLRDGGYYNQWDFSKSVVDEYIKAANNLPIDYIEVGYRNNPLKDYLGKYGYCPAFELTDIRNKSTKKVAVMIDEKNVGPADLINLIEPIKSLVDMVRIAVDPQNFDRAVILAEGIKKYGLQVGFNTMYMSKWQEYDGFFNKLAGINGVADVFYMVDSFGGVSPAEVKEILLIVKEKTTCAVGFHGHNNLEMGLINTVTAIDNGVDYVDATVLGIGRGAGNLKLELLLTYLNKYYERDVDFNVLGDVIAVFSGLFERYKWGTNLPYMLSAANSFPQKDIMDWINTRAYSFNNIVRALDNRRLDRADNAKYPITKMPQFDKVIVVGGGSSAVLHADAVKAFINQNQSVALIHATTRNAAYYNDLAIPQYYCLAGNEEKRLTTVFSNIPFNGKCILPPYPRKMGTDVPIFVQDATVELPYIEFTSQYLDSCTAVALQSAALCCNNEIFLVGYDGYLGNILSEKEAVLTKENNILFSSFINFYNKPLVSLTPSLYGELDVRSVYRYL